MQCFTPINTFVAGEKSVAEEIVTCQFAPVGNRCLGCVVFEFLEFFD